MRHDGPLADNNCDPGSFLMSPTLGSGKITWSACSRQYLNQFLHTPQSHCLMDHSSSDSHLNHNEGGTLPGERFNANQQCMLKYGRGSVHASSQPMSDVCRDLHCTRDRYTWTSHPALEGTLCDTNKWCRSGRCVDKGLSVLQAVQQAVTGGWSDWTPYSDCASSCLYGDKGTLASGSTGVMVSSRLCNNPRPENGGDPCVGSDKRYKTCSPNQCENIPRTTIQNYADEVCIRAREVDSELTGTGFQKASSNPGDACSIWCERHGGGVKSKGWSFPDGTVCQTLRRHKPMYCIAGSCQEFKCLTNSDDETFLISPGMCASTLLFSRDKRREIAVGIWLPVSDCYFNCITPGRGIRLVEKRQCQYCNITASIQLCPPKNKVCDNIKTTVEQASAVCTKYRDKVQRLSGFGMQLSASHEDPDRPCRLACQDESIPHRFYLVNGEEGWFPFGTDCSRGDTTKKAYCISGRCLEFGSDDSPLHEPSYGFLDVHSRYRRSVEGNSSFTFSNNYFHKSTGFLGLPAENESSDFSIDVENPIDVQEKELYTFNELDIH